MINYLWLVFSVLKNVWYAGLQDGADSRVLLKDFLSLVQAGKWINLFKFRIRKFRMPMLVEG